MTFKSLGTWFSGMAAIAPPDLSARSRTGSLQVLNAMRWSMPRLSSAASAAAPDRAALRVAGDEDGPVLVECEIRRAHPVKPGPAQHCRRRRFLSVEKKGEVEAARLHRPVQPDIGVAGDLQFDGRVTLANALEKRGQHSRAETLDRADPDRPGDRPGARLLEEAVVTVEQGLRGRKQLLARRRQPHIQPGAVEQAHAELVLKRADPRGYGSLRNSDQLGGGRETLLGRDADEGAQELDLNIGCRHSIT